MKSLFRILAAVVGVVILVAAVVVAANYFSTGKVQLPLPAAEDKATANQTKFYVAGDRVSQPWINGYNLHGGYFGSGSTFTLSVNWRYALKGDLVVPKLSLQRMTGKTWETVATDLPFGKKSDVTAVVPAYKTAAGVKSAKVSYRFVSSAYRGPLGSVVNTSYSEPVSVTYENPKLYVGFAKTMYKDIQAYCPNTAIHVIKNADKNSYEAGEYIEGQLYIKVDSRIRQYANRSDQRTVALHECAHERQFLNYGATATGWQQMEFAAKSIFTNDPTPAGTKATPGGQITVQFSAVEHAADCAALSINPGGYLGYGGYCNKQELAAGKRLLQGKQF